MSNFLFYSHFIHIMSPSLGDARAEPPLQLARGVEPALLASMNLPPWTSKPAQTATLLSRGEAPEAEIGTGPTTRQSGCVGRTWHFGHHQCPLVIELPTLEAAWGRAGRCGAGLLRAWAAWSGGVKFGRSALICAEQSGGGIACHSIRRPNPAEMCGRLPACRPGRGPASRISAFTQAENFGAPLVSIPEVHLTAISSMLLVKLHAELAAPGHVGVTVVS
jgi:hypothetical protein